MHTDAAQAVGKIPIDVDTLGVDLLSIAGHKLYAPKGVGALYIRRGTAVQPVLRGAGHEGGLRPGTENVASIVALGVACTLADEPFPKGPAQHLLKRLKAEIPGVRLHGPEVQRLPNTLNIGFVGAMGSAVSGPCSRARCEHRFRVSRGRREPIRGAARHGALTRRSAWRSTPIPGPRYHPSRCRPSRHRPGRGLAHGHRTRMSLETHAERAPFPILSVLRDGRIAWANDASRPLLEAWGVAVGDPLPNSTAERIALVASQGVDALLDQNIGGREWELHLCPSEIGDRVRVFARDRSKQAEAERLLLVADRAPALRPRPDSASVAGWPRGLEQHRLPADARRMGSRPGPALASRAERRGRKDTHRATSPYRGSGRR